MKAQDISQQRTLSPKEADTSAKIPVYRAKSKRYTLSAWGMWLAIPIILGILLSIADWDNLLNYPYAQTTYDFGDKIGGAVTNFINNVADRYRAVLEWPALIIAASLENVDRFLLTIPWPAQVLLVTIIAWRLAGIPTALFAFSALMLMIVIGLWDDTILTMALIFVSVTAAVIIAVPLGIVTAESKRSEAIVRPILDTMQTLPSMVYLVPALAFFSIGNTAGVVATTVFAIPPAAKLTDIGIRQAPGATIEAAEAFGATPIQLLMEVKIPLALPFIFAGISQATMAALGIVVVAALVGTRGLGDIVETALGRIETGPALLAGMGIVFIAIIIDRIAEAFAKRTYASLGFDEDGTLRY